jgi:hypothetical protein
MDSDMGRDRNMDGEEDELVRWYDRNGEPHDEVLRTKTGRVITEEDIAKWAEEAMEGYDDQEQRQIDQIVDDRKERKAFGGDYF